MTRFCAILAYDGGAYQGFQRQPAPAPTIQATVETAIAKVCGETAGVVAAGRTDAGVHAAGQVIAFDAAWRHGDAEFLRAINSQLPKDIALQEMWRQAGFHPRYDACWRQYAYHVALLSARQPLLEGRAWQLIGESLDLAALRRAARICLGEHDFAAFGRPPQPGSQNTTRRIFCASWQRQEGTYGISYFFRIRGTAFLYHMVRRLVGAMAQVGRGRIASEDFEAILRSRDINRAKTLAPAQGLILERVGYPPRKEREGPSGDCAAKQAERSLEANT